MDAFHLSDSEPDAWRRLHTTMAQHLLLSGVADDCLAIGEVAPDFELADGLGTVVSLQCLLADGPVVVTFVQGGWNPFCVAQLRSWQQHYRQVLARGGELLAIAPIGRAAARTLAARLHLEFQLLPDADGHVTHLFGLRCELPPGCAAAYRDANVELPVGADGMAWLPLPATFLIDRLGVASYAFAHADFGRRANPADVVEILRRF